MWRLREAQEGGGKMDEYYFYVTKEVGCGGRGVDDSRFWPPGPELARRWLGDHAVKQAQHGICARLLAHFVRQRNFMPATSCPQGAPLQLHSIGRDYFSDSHYDE